MSTVKISTFLFLLFTGLEASAQPLLFGDFLKPYLLRSGDLLRAQRTLSNAESTKVQKADLWKSRLSATPKLSFEDQKFEGGGRNNNTNRTSNLTGEFTQGLPTGTQLQISGQKFLETQNPLFSALDRSYSAKITQDLFRNAFGESQIADKKKGATDFEVAQLQFQQTILNSCEKAFSLYTNAYVQQEVAQLLDLQLQDAKKALDISRRLYQDRLINRLDKLASESDFIELQLQVQRAEQQLVNTKREMAAYLPQDSSNNFSLKSPAPYLNFKPVSNDEITLAEKVINKQLKSQNLEIKRSRSERRTDIQLGLEAGEEFGRLALNGPIFNYNAEYLRASVTFGFDLINDTEDVTLKNALYQKNSLVKEELALAQTQKAKVQSLMATSKLLKSQISSSEKQVQLLQEKMKIAFNQMKRAQLDFQNYLLHRNAYLSQQRNFLDLKKDYWLNQLALQKEFSQSSPQFCEVSS